MPDNVLRHTVAADSTDSIAPVDTSQLFHAPVFADSFPTLTAADSVPSDLDEIALVAVPSGAPATARRQPLLHDTATMSLLLASLFFLAVSYRTGYKYITNLLHNMFSVRLRETLFEDTTVKETQILSALIGLTCVMEGILLFRGLQLWHPPLSESMQRGMGLHILLFVGLAIAFYLAQLAFYNLLGYIFADKDSTKVWIDGFKASQSLLGLLLFPVVAVLLVVTDYAEQWLITAAILYICARLIFIIKGFRIFNNGLLSGLYFILYLCAVEIVPLALAYGVAMTLCAHLQS